MRKGRLHLHPITTPVIQVASDGQTAKETWITLDIGIMSCLLYTSPSPRDATLSRMPSSA